MLRLPSVANHPRPATDAAAASDADPQLSPTPAPPANDDSISDDEIVRVTSNLVVVPVSVTNERGEPVQGLKAADFRLEEEGRAQEIAQVGDADQVPLDIAILFDVSSSIRERFEFEQQAAARFLKQVMKPIDRAAVFAIGERPRLEQQLASAEVASAKLLGLPAPQKPTPTAFYDTTINAARYLAQNAPGRHRRVIVVISDGDDNYSTRTKEGEVADARAVNRGEALPANARTRRQETHQKALLKCSAKCNAPMQSSTRSIRAAAASVQCTRTRARKVCNNSPTRPVAHLSNPNNSKNSTTFFVASPPNSAPNTYCNTIQTATPRTANSSTSKSALPRAPMHASAHARVTT
jgi:VWFA-related protein